MTHRNEKFGHNDDEHPLKTSLQNLQSCCRDKPIKICCIANNTSSSGEVINSRERLSKTSAGCSPALQ